MAVQGAVVKTDFEKYTNELIDFIHDNPSTYHVVDAFSRMLLENGFSELKENEGFTVEKGKSYFVTRNGTSLIAFRIPKGDISSYSIVSAHTDSPCFKIKHNPEVCSSYTTLNVEPYGGLLMAPWFDRPLSVAGRVLVRKGNGVESRLLNFDRDLVQIVSLAIHQNRKANEGINYNVQKELLPIFSLEGKSGSFMDAIKEQLGVELSDILDYDLFLYSRAKGSIWGLENEFFSAPRIDDLEMSFASVKALMNVKETSSMPFCVLFDNEEVGSGSKQGALSDFMTDVIKRIENALSFDDETSKRIKASSFMLSADNAHAFHPNYPECSDITNKVLMNKGIVIKYSSNQKYTTDGLSAAKLRLLLENNDIPYQIFFNNSNYPGGSTLGNLSAQKYSVNTVDIGAAQLAMHSVVETAGTKDLYYFIKAFESFYSFRGSL